MALPATVSESVEHFIHEFLSQMHKKSPALCEAEEQFCS